MPMKNPPHPGELIRAEVIEALGLSVPAVKSRLLRARLQLRERLSRYFRRKKGVEK